LNAPIRGVGGGGKWRSGTSLLLATSQAEERDIFGYDGARHLPSAASLKDLLLSEGKANSLRRSPRHLREGRNDESRIGGGTWVRLTSQQKKSRTHARTPAEYHQRQRSIADKKKGRSASVGVQRGRRAVQKEGSKKGRSDQWRIGLSS